MEEEEFEEDSEEEEEEDLSHLFRRINQLWKKRQGNFRGSRRPSSPFKSNYGQKKSGASKDITCFKCKEPGHYKDECPKLRKYKPMKKVFKGKKKVLTPT